MGISGGCSAKRFPVSDSAKLIKRAMIKAILMPIFRICFSMSGGCGLFIVLSLLLCLLIYTLKAMSAERK